MPIERCLSTQFDTISFGTVSCAHSASRARSSRFGSLTCGTRRQYQAVASAPVAAARILPGFRSSGKLMILRAVCDGRGRLSYAPRMSVDRKGMHMDTFTEIAAKWAQQAVEVSEVVDAVALPSERQATLSDGKPGHVGPNKTEVSGILPETPRNAFSRSD